MERVNQFTPFEVHFCFHSSQEHLNVIKFVALGTYKS
jgi:hypothetical protein